MLVKLAVDVVREAMEAGGSARGDTSAVRLALRVRLPHRLRAFWTPVAYAPAFVQLQENTERCPKSGHTQ